MIIPRILITSGEPAGIGPDILLQMAQFDWQAELVVVSDLNLLLSRAEQLDISIKLRPLNIKNSPEIHQPGTLKILPVDLVAPCQAGQLNLDNALYVIGCLELATEYCLEKMADALVTGPVHKAIINQAGIPFTGHTEFLAEFCNVPQVLMLFVVDRLKVALATTHLPLSAVPNAITTAHLKKSLRLLHHEIKKYFKIDNPKILVSGLNPHAGESGLLGREEIETMIPALADLTAENIDVVGPLPADTLFTEKNLKLADVIFAMYHDQALPVIKHIGFDRAVNLTLGLPIIRTSVDHGTALDVAGTKNAEAGSLKAAIELAIKLAMG